MPPRRGDLISQKKVVSYPAATGSGQIGRLGMYLAAICPAPLF